MDTINIPACAMYRQSGTVIVRTKKEVSFECGLAGCVGDEHCNEAVCGQYDCVNCRRTRFCGLSSGCDSGLVERCKLRQHRSRWMRSRYFTFWAAIFVLLLLVESTRSIPLTKMAENSLWANPCDYSESTSKKLDYTSKRAKDIAVQARHAANNAAEYKDDFARVLYSYTTFEDLVPLFKGILLGNWMREKDWFVEEILPESKKYDQEAPQSYVEDVVNNIDEFLPLMNKALKLVVAGLQALETDGFDLSLKGERPLRDRISATKHNVRSVLCYFNEILRARNLNILPLTDSEISLEISLENRFFIYRDTMNYLQYLAQVFQALSERPVPQ